MESLGGTIGKNEWDGLWYVEHASDDLIKKHMKVAAHESKVGETVLLISKLLERKSITEVSNHTLFLVINALNQVGLEEVARNLAMEALNMT